MTATSTLLKTRNTATGCALPARFPRLRAFPAMSEGRDRSLSDHLITLCLALGAWGETMWSALLADAYYGKTGNDALWSTLEVLLRLRRHNGIVRRLFLESEVDQSISLLHRALTSVAPQRVPRVAERTVREMLAGIR